MTGVSHPGEKLKTRPDLAWFLLFQNKKQGLAWMKS